MLPSNNLDVRLPDDAPENVVLLGIAGSTAFGLAHADSDIDLHGVYMAPTLDVLGLHGGAVTSKSYTHSDPDIQLHEIGKFISLALKCNPTIIETLWLDDYVTMTEVGAFLVDARSCFLSENYVRNAYTGYALSQLSKERAFQTPKAARHAIRILDAGIELLTTGELTVNRSADRDKLFELGELAVELPDEFLVVFNERKDRLTEADTVLPETPNTKFFENHLPSLRLLSMS